MAIKRVKLTVFVNLDPTPGTFHTPEDASIVVEALLRDRIRHYAPVVLVSQDQE